MLVKSKKEKHGIYLKFDGIFTKDQLINCGNNYSDQYLDKITYILINLKAVDKFKINSSDTDVQSAYENIAALQDKEINVIFVVNEKVIGQVEYYRQLMIKHYDNWKMILVGSEEIGRSLL